jgi:hypothetical protein
VVAMSVRSSWGTRSSSFAGYFIDGVLHSGAFGTRSGEVSNHRRTLWCRRYGAVSFPDGIKAPRGKLLLAVEGLRLFGLGMQS